MVTRHEFLARLHELLRPARYLEIGVQYGHSLKLAHPWGTFAMGIDPNPLCEPGPSQCIYTQTSREFFGRRPANLNIDFAFIDGSHLVEDAIFDFESILEHSHDRTVIVFDDVLPYTQKMTSRTQIPGDWTGDVWKVTSWIEWNFPFMATELVDTSPTGLLVCWNVKSQRNHFTLLEAPPQPDEVPQEILTRSDWVSPPETAFQLLQSWWRNPVSENPPA